MTKKKRKYSIEFTTPSLTLQSEKNNCNINTIMSKYEATGQIPILNSKQPQYGDFSEVKTYQEALNQIQEANDLFNQLPSNIRKQFDNNPAQFVEFADNPKNQDKMREMGLLPPLPPEKNDESNDEKRVDNEKTQKPAENQSLGKQS